MEFLGYSQTFIGILASLVVLCVLINTSNFIHEILKDIGDKIDQEIDSLNHAITIETAYDKEVKGKASYKLLQQFIATPWENEKHKGEALQKLHSEALQLDMELKASFDNFKSEYSPKFIKPARALITTVQESKEQVIAPLYVLLYCLVVFICDEVVYNVQIAESFIVTFLTLFTSLSFGLWAILWFFFINEIKIVPEESRKAEDKRHKTEIRMCNHLKWKRAIAYITILGIVFFALSIVIPHVIVRGIVAFGIGVFFPVLFVAVCKIRGRSQLREYMFAFRHFVGLLFLSLSIASISMIALALSEEMSQICFRYNDFAIIKITVISFIIVNGLLLPFIIPFKAFYRILALTEKEVGTTQDKLNKKLKEAVKRLDVFCDKL